MSTTTTRYSELGFGKNRSARWTILMPGTFSADPPEVTLNCSNGINVRKASDAPSSASLTLSGVTKDDVVIFNKVEDSVTEGAVYFTYSSVLGGDPTGLTNNYYLQLIFDNKNNSISIHDNCFEDFYKSNSTTKRTDIFFKHYKGDYIYDEEKASFIEYDEDTHGRNVQLWDATTVSTLFQQYGTPFDSYVELNDISFADYAIKDKAIEVYINASVSVAGLTLNWASNTSVEFQDTVGRFSLGDIVETGSFNNNTVKYTGNRFIVSKKLQPDSKVASAIRYKIVSDFVSNGYDELEIHDINILTEMSLVEGGDNA